MFIFFLARGRDKNKKKLTKNLYKPERLINERCTNTKLKGTSFVSKRFRERKKTSEILKRDKFLKIYSFSFNAFLIKLRFPLSMMMKATIDAFLLENFLFLALAKKKFFFFILVFLSFYHNAWLASFTFPFHRQWGKNVFKKCAIILRSVLFRLHFDAVRIFFLSNY